MPVRQKQTQRQTVIVNVGTKPKRRAPKSRRVTRSAPAIAVQQVIPPIPLSHISMASGPGPDFAQQFIRAMASLGEGIRARVDRPLAPQISLNSPNILREVQTVETAMGKVPFKAEEEAVGYTDFLGAYPAEMKMAQETNEPAMASTASSSSESSSEPSKPPRPGLEPVYASDGKISGYRDPEHPDTVILARPRKTPEPGSIRKMPMVPHPAMLSSEVSSQQSLGPMEMEPLSELSSSTSTLSSSSSSSSSEPFPRVIVRHQPGLVKKPLPVVVPEQKWD